MPPPTLLNAPSLKLEKAMKMAHEALNDSEDLRLEAEARFDALRTHTEKIIAKTFESTRNHPTFSPDTIQKMVLEELAKGEIKDADA